MTTTTKAERPDATDKKADSAAAKPRKPFRWAFGVLTALGVYTVGQLLIAPGAPVVYLLIMIPASAIGVMFWFVGNTITQRVAVTEHIDRSNAIVLLKVAEVRDEVTIVMRRLNDVEHRQEKTDDQVEALAGQQGRTQLAIETLNNQYEDLKAELHKLHGSEETAYLAGYNDGQSSGPPNPPR